MFLSRLAALLLVLSLTAGQRVHWTVEGNPIDLFGVAFVAVAGLLWAHDSVTLRPVKPYRAVALNTVGPFFTLLVVLPVFGVMAGWYNITVLYTWMTVAVPLGILSLGRAARLRGLRIDRIIFVLIVAHGIYGLGQTLVRIGVVPDDVWASQQWDIAAQSAINEAYVVVGRSTGLFLNANAYGFWSCGAILAGAVLFTGWRRNIAIILGVVGVVSSQSRTAWAGLALLLVILTFVMLRHARVAERVFLTSVVLAPVVIIAAMAGAFTSLIESDLVSRFTSGVGVISGGVAADTNLSARVDSWSAAADFSAEYPFGTLGPPQALFISSVDNQYVSLFLQGGVLLVGAYLFALLSPLVLARRGVPYAGALAVTSALFTIASFTMLPFESPAAAIYWLLAAAAFSTAPKTETVEKAAAGQVTRAL